MYARKLNGAWEEWDGKPLPFFASDPTQKFHVPQEWSEEEKMVRFGLHRVIETPLPVGKLSLSHTLVDDGGKPRKIDVFEETEAALLAWAAAKRWQVETGGLIVAGSAIDTGRESQSMITGAYSYSQANPTELIRFKAASGWVTLDAPTVAAIATAVGAHVQACFAVEEALATAIGAGTVTTIAEIDAANWPG
ncbi:DUF4376 domain-containing protein [Kaistia sp. UC242_56]|uniref:DUF4376 domain-containing protein n=1 Tax=Kaistia sp. UC242_56 TaxID=3374625 RepID=UPI0037BB3ED6